VPNEGGEAIEIAKFDEYFRPCDEVCAYVDGELSAEHHAAFSDHLPTCAYCCREVHEMMQLAALEASLRASQPEH
jgi:anti-sigma factor RsiW